MSQDKKKKGGPNKTPEPPVFESDRLIEELFGDDADDAPGLPSLPPQIETSELDKSDLARLLQGDSEAPIVESAPARPSLPPEIEMSEPDESDIEGLLERPSEAPEVEIEPERSSLAPEIETGPSEGSAIPPPESDAGAPAQNVRDSWVADLGESPDSSDADRVSQVRSDSGFWLEHLKSMSEKPPAVIEGDEREPELTPPSSAISGVVRSSRVAAFPPRDAKPAATEDRDEDEDDSFYARFEAGRKTQTRQSELQDESDKYLSSVPPVVEQHPPATGEERDRAFSSAPPVLGQSQSEAEGKRNLILSSIPPVVEMAESEREPSSVDGILESKPAPQFPRESVKPPTPEAFPPPEEASIFEAPREELFPPSRRRYRGCPRPPRLLRRPLNRFRYGRRN